MTTLQWHLDPERPTGDPPPLPQVLHALLEDIAHGAVRVSTAAERRLVHRLTVAMAAFDSASQVVGAEAAAAMRHR